MEQGVGEFAEKDRDVLFAAGDVKDLVVDLFELTLEDVFPEGDELGDVDVAVVDGSLGFEGVDELDRIALAAGPVQAPERQEDGFRAGTELQEFELEELLEALVGDDLGKLVIVRGGKEFVFFEVFEFCMDVEAAPGIVGGIELGHPGTVIGIKGAVEVEESLNAGKVHADIAFLDLFAADRPLYAEVIEVHEIDIPAVELRFDGLEEGNFVPGAFESKGGHIALQLVHGLFADQD